MTDIETRLVLLEKKNTRLQVVLFALVGIIGFGVLAGAAGPKKAGNKDDQNIADEVKAKRLVIVDDDGNERIVLEVAEKKFSNEKTDKRKAVFATIRIVTPEGTECASLDATDIGYTRLKLFNEEGKKRIEAVTSPNPTGFAKLFFYDNDGKEVTKQFP